MKKNLTPSHCQHFHADWRDMNGATGERQLAAIGNALPLSAITAGVVSIVTSTSSIEKVG